MKKTYILLTPIAVAVTHQPDKNGSSYYRIQGTHVIIEFSLQGVGGAIQRWHIHTSYRDPGSEYEVTFKNKTVIKIQPV